MAWEHSKPIDWNKALHCSFFSVSETQCLLHEELSGVFILIQNLCCPMHWNSSCSVTSLNVNTHHAIIHIPEEKEIMGVYGQYQTNSGIFWLLESLALQYYILLTLFRQLGFKVHMSKCLFCNSEFVLISEVWLLSHIIGTESQVHATQCPRSVHTPWNNQWASMSRSWNFRDLDGKCQTCAITFEISKSSWIISVLALHFGTQASL